MANVNAVMRAANILQALAEGPEYITILSGKTGLSVSTLHRLLKTLEKAGFAIQDPLTRQYALGPLIPALAMNLSISHHGLIVCAHDSMEQLRGLTGESVALVIRMGAQRVQLEELPSSQTFKFSAGRGFAAPIYAGSTGRVLLAEMKNEEVEKLLNCLTIKKVGPQSIVNKKILLRKIENTRRNGYAMAHGEIIEGAFSLAVPIKGYICPVAMCILAPASRFLDQAEKYVPVMQKFSKTISSRLKTMQPMFPNNLK